MKIFALSYSNIGPFSHRILSIFVKEGKHLIQSPIGRGKSFLFFDGIIYALYGYSKRDMLNVECEDGFVKILFQNDDNDTYLIQRPLVGRKGVLLYRYTGENIEALLSQHEDIIVFDKDFTDSLPMDVFEKIEFHRSSELQQHIDILLPPRSVFLQRHIIMQNEENIFDLQPKARIEILKKMFGLDAIDTLRDSLSDIKNNLKGQLKVLQDSTHLHTQYEKYYQVAYTNFISFISWFDDVSTNIQGGEQEYAITVWKDFHLMSDIVSLLRKYCHDPLISHIDSLFSELSDISIQVFSDYFDYISKKQQEYTYVYNNLLEKKLQNAHKIELYNKNIGEFDMLLSKVLVDLQQYTIKNDNYTRLESEKREYEIKCSALNSNISPEIRAIIMRYAEEEKKDITIQDGINIQQVLLQIGNIKKSELEVAKQKLDQLYQSIEHKKQSLDQYKQQLLYIEQSQWNAYVVQGKNELRELELIIDQKKQTMQSLELQKNDIYAALDKLQSSLHYQCEKIQSPCPFIDAILQANNLDQDIQKQEHKKLLCEQSIVDLDRELSDIQKTYLAKQNLIQSLRREDFVYSGTDREELSIKIKQIDGGGISQSDQLQIAQCQANINNIEQSLQEVRKDFVSIRDTLSHGIQDSFQEYTKKLISIHDELLEIQKEQQLYSSILLKKQEYSIQKEQAQASLIECEIEKQGIEGDIEFHFNQLNSIQGYHIESLGVLLHSIGQDIRKLSDLFYEKKRISLDSDIKKQELHYATLLHTITNKELVLYILNSSLPLLTEYINQLLMKVVSFQLRMQIHEDGDELELFIEDELGVREVKSLSGGQKTVLKLCRVLATSIVFRNSFLFLDETINNVDEEVTARLTDMLLEYMRNYNLTFYTVSHSPQLQAMDIRDGIISIPSAV